MTSSLRVSEQGIKLLKLLEGFRDKAYQCSAGKWTIGYGNTHGVKQGDSITEEKADQDLRILASRIGDFLNKNLKVSLSQQQFDALVSFVYNVGEGAFLNSQVHQLINHDCLSQIPWLFQRWKYVTVNGEKVESLGLIKRRKFESKMWNEGLIGGT